MLAVFAMKRTVTVLFVALVQLALQRSVHGLDSIPATTSVRLDSTANYTGPYRPQIHFSPPEHFMNDPNGLFLDGTGTYHLYYQYNPTNIVGGNQHWGHATSTDLYHWVNQPIAIAPPTSDTQVYTGSAVIDVNNTSGFFPNQTDGIVAIYTLNTPSAQVQEIAYSLDGGYTFSRYEGNPVINSTSTNFRDPKVIWHEDTQRWVMSIAFAQDRVIGFYTSPDLKAWTLASNFTHPEGLPLQYECPNIVRMPVRDPNTLELIEDEEMYVLTSGMSSGAPFGGSATQYFPGTFNGTHFTPVDSTTRLVDFAKDFYAAQFFYLPAGASSDSSDPLSIAWASNLPYSGGLPTAGEGWRSTMSLPRRTFLANIPGVGWDLVSRPVDLSPVLGAQLAARDGPGNDAEPLTVDFSQVESKALYFEANVTGLSSSALDPTAALNFTFLSATTGESLVGGYSFGGDHIFFLDRKGTHGFSDVTYTNSTRFSTVVSPREDGTWTLSGVIDRSIVEVFVDGGTYSGTSLFFATEPLTVMTLATAGLPAEVSVSVAVYALKSVWVDVEAAQEPPEAVLVLG